MTIPARHPAKANQPEFDGCIDTDACRLIADQALTMAPIFDAEPFIPRQSTLSIDAPADLLDVIDRSLPYRTRRS
jgi:hypothetical protein